MATLKKMALIPARGGSKRIPHKNIKEFLGKPLIAYSIAAACDSGLFDRIVVSTDDGEIASTAQKCGAEVPFMRDKTLADDFTGTFAVTQDGYRQMRLLGFDADVVCTIYATAPLLTGGYLKKAFELFSSEHADSIYACCEFPFPIQRARTLDEHGEPHWVMPEHAMTRSQDLPKTYQDAGLFYMYSRAMLLNPKSPTLVHRAFEMPRHRVIDIDTPEDWNYAQAMAKAVGELGLE